MSKRLVFGLVGPKCSHEARKRWNAYFTEKNLDAFFDFYKTTTVSDLELRLSEMFLLERRGYLIDKKFQKECVRLMDQLDESAEREGKVDAVVNERGVLKGYFANTTDIDILHSCLRTVS